MSALSTLALLANLHGGGAYVEAGVDSSWTDRLGLVARGSRLIVEGGYFTGDYRGSYGFGTYWNFGVGFSWEPIYLIGVRSAPGEQRENVLLEHFYFPHLTIGRSADIFRLGLGWKIRFGPIWSVDEDKFWARDASWGGAVVGELAGIYNVGSVFGLGPRLGLGAMIDTDRFAYQVNLGLVMRFSIPVLNVKTAPEARADYWEEDY